jgi:hypothetical protein
LVSSADGNGLADTLVSNDMKAPPSVKNFKSPHSSQLAQVPDARIGICENKGTKCGNKTKNL